MKNLTLQQKVLAYGAVYEKRDNLVDYDIVVWTKYLKNAQILESELLNSFVQNKNSFQAYCREQLFQIMKDEKIDQTTRRNRLSRYIDAYFNLLCMLDDEVFEHDDFIVYTWVPTYIPDGMSDMGSDPEIDNTKRRGREKLHINKKKVLEDAKDLFMEIFSTENINKKQIVGKISNYIYKGMSYDRINIGSNLHNSLPLTDFVPNNPNKKDAVCRHHALVFQVLNQTLWITSRLLKCNVDFFDDMWKKTWWWAHGCNLVRLDGQRYLIDSTNPYFLDWKWKVGKEIDEKYIDLNNNMYIWTVDHDDWRRVYRSRNNMYYRIKRT